MSFALRSRACLLFALTGALLASCAVPGGPTGGGGTPSRMPGSDDQGASERLLYTLRVSEVRGRAWVQRDGRAFSLKVGSPVAENQPIQVGSGSILRLQLGDKAKFELAPNSRLVVHQLPHQGLGDARATWLRLEQGYLRIQWNGALIDPPMQVSFGIWAARLKPGEYFFDTRGRVAAACASQGSMRLSGVPEWTPQEPMQQCLRLEANKAPLTIAMSDAQWSTVRAQRRLHPTLALATRNQSSAAIARLEREQVRSPGPRPPAPAAEAAPVARAPAVVAPPAVALMPRTPIPTAPSRRAPDEDDRARARTADELIREAEEVRKAPRATPPPPDSVMPAPAPSVALGSNPTISPLPPMPAPTRAPRPITPPPPPPPPEPVYEPAPPPLTQHTPPVIVIPAEPEPVPAPPPPPAPPPVAMAPSPPPPPPPPLEAPAPAPRTPPVITIPAEPAPVARSEPPPPSSIELAEQSPVVIPPPTQPSAANSTRRVGSATPPSVPLDVAMYSVAAMPDNVGGSESALIVPPTITHEPAKSQWLVNIASYPSIEPAQEHARMLVKQKLRAGVREQALPNRMSYLVVIEGYATEEAAETAAIDLEAQFDLDPY